jgi:hypothetical protein
MGRVGAVEKLLLKCGKIEKGKRWSDCVSRDLVAEIMVAYCLSLSAF